MDKWMVPEMAELVRELYDAGFRIDLIAERCGVSEGRVRYAVRNRGGYRTRPNRNCTVDYEQVRKLASTEYHTLEDLGDRFGVTRERIRQILAGMTYDRKRIMRKKRPATNVISEFLRSVGGSFDPDDKCILWTGAGSDNGKPVIYVGHDKCISARGFIFKLYGGFLVPGGAVFPICRTECCVNPYHMDTPLNRNMRNAPMVSRRGGTRNFAKLSENAVVQIKARLMNGESAKSIASQYEVRYETILNIRRGHTWKHISWHDPATL